jgi:hypothetical protein
MSSYPYRNEPDSFHTFTLKTEFMLMDADGGHQQQLTHFNVPGYPESQPTRTVAAIGWFIPSSQLYAIVMGPEFISSSWIITLQVRVERNHRSTSLTGIRVSHSLIRRRNVPQS